MLKYVILRVLWMVPALLAASLVIFVVLNIVPGQASTAALGLNPEPAARKAFDHRYGLDRPLAVRYVSWLGGVVHGDFGRSFQTDISIGPELGRRIPVTLELTFLAALIAVLIAMPLGTIAAMRQGKLPDVLSSILSVAGLSVPAFATAMVLILLVSLRLGWLPSGGYVSFPSDPVGNLKRMILPAVSLGVVSASLMRIYRSSLIDQFNRDYIRAARAKGLPEWRIFRRHAFRNAVVPFMTAGAIEVSAIFGGSVVIEQIFQLPGLGSYVLIGIQQRDYFVLQAAALTITLFVLTANLLVDLFSGWLDPRLRRV